jgi:uncharacterized protein
MLLFGFIHVASAQAVADENTQTRAVVQAFLNELGNKNPEKIAACFAEDIDWYIFESEKFPWTGRRTKRAEVAVVFQTLFSYFNDGKDKFILGSFMVDGSEAALFAQLGRQFKKTGRDFLMHVAINFTVANGKIVKFYLYEQTPILEKAYE